MEPGIMEFTLEEKRKCVTSKSWNVSLADWSKGMHVPHCSVQVC